MLREKEKIELKDVQGIREEKNLKSKKLGREKAKERKKKGLAFIPKSREIYSDKVNRHKEDTIQTEYEFNKDLYDRLGITKEQHDYILNELNHYILEAICNNNEGFELPEGLGNIRITGMGNKPSFTHKALSRKFGKAMPGRNPHTGNIIFSLTLRNRGYSFYKYKNFRRIVINNVTASLIKKTIDEVGYSHWSVFYSYGDMKGYTRIRSIKNKKRILLSEMEDFINGKIDR
jgi:nucleoid DNA-binding protein